MSDAHTLAADAALAAIGFAVLALAGAALSRRPLAPRLGLGRSRLRSGHAWAVLGLLGLSHALGSALELIGWSQAGAPLQLQQALRGLPLAALLLPLASLALLTPLGEELFFRGLVQRGLAAPLGAPAAIATGAVLFALAHGDAATGAAALLLGAYLGALTHVADSIRPALLAHVANNALAVVEAALGAAAWGGAPADWLLLAAGAGLAAAGLTAIARAGLQWRADSAERSP